METVCLADLWQHKLHSLGWSERACKQFVLCWAPSTFSHYNRVCVKFQGFCGDNNVKFPPIGNSAIIVDYLCQVSDKSDRPESAIKMTSAALGCLYESLGVTNPMANGDVKRMVTSLVKSGTKKPLCHTKPMPVEPFYKLFRSWNDNNVLPMDMLRLKCVTLLALSFMARPSDLAPRGETFDFTDGHCTSLLFTRNQVKFHDDGSLTIVFFGIKNDASRTGFEVRIPGNPDVKIDPVRCLQCYLCETENYCLQGNTNAVFISLKGPYAGIKADTIANVLKKAINLAGLDGQGFTPRCFRATGATVAVQSGIKPESAMQIGRWKSSEVFYNRYVYPMAPKGYTEDISRFQGVSYDN